MRFDFLHSAPSPPNPKAPALPRWVSVGELRRLDDRRHLTGPDPYAGLTVASTTRQQLSALLACEGREITLTTASPRVLGDLDLLRELDGKHTVSITLALAAVDLELARRVDPLGPDPRAVLSAAARLSEEGLTTRLLCRPLLAGVNSLERTLRPLFETAQRLAVIDVLPDPAAEEGALGPFERLRLAYGFPQRVPGRG
jgi:hypothetical protein